MNAIPPPRNASNSLTKKPFRALRSPSSFFFPLSFPSPRPLFSPSLFFIPLLFLTPTFCTAQSPLASLSFDTVVVNQQRSCEMVIELTDTLFTAVEVGLGSSRNQTDLFFLEVPADPSQGLPSGITLSREGYRLTLGIGWLPVKDYYYGQLRVKNASGVWSPLYKFFQN